jgi:hypothetical protein
MIDPRNADVRAEISREDAVQGEGDAVGRGAVDGPVTFVDLADSQGPGKGKAVRRSALLSRGGDHVNLADQLHRGLERLDPVGVVTVVVGYQYSRSFFGHLCKRKSIGKRAGNCHARAETKTREDFTLTRFVFVSN